MLTESGSGTLAGNAHQEAFSQVAKADAVIVSEALQRDFDAPMLAAAYYRQSVLHHPHRAPWPARSC
jgi:hypothetical protein